MEAKPKGESAAHRQLKRAALVWAQLQGYTACATEVRIPNCLYRADVAAYRKGRQKKGIPPVIGETAIFECKQSRSDFLTDAHPEQESLARLTSCRKRLAKLETLLGTHHPHLGKGDSLFPEFESHDLAAIPHEGYRRLLAEIRKLESRVFGKTKFDRMVRYGCANAFYLVVGEGVLTDHEVPLDWGLLRLGSPETDELELLRKPVLRDAVPTARLELLQHIASIATRLSNRAEKIDTTALSEARRRGLPFPEKPKAAGE
jgi:hypothetical protein